MKTIIITISCIIQIIFLSAFANAEDILKPYTFTNGTTADATQVNANFDTVYSRTNNNTRDISTLANSVIRTATDVKIMFSDNAGLYEDWDIQPFPDWVMSRSTGITTIKQMVIDGWTIQSVVQCSLDQYYIVFVR